MPPLEMLYRLYAVAACAVMVAAGAAALLHPKSEAPPLASLLVVAAGLFVMGWLAWEALRPRPPGGERERES